MKYVLLAFAILLAAFGCLSLSAGFVTIFDSTMGSLLAGVIALGCGILVAGQVLILRALESLKIAIDRRDALSQAASAETPFGTDYFEPAPYRVETPSAPAAPVFAPQAAVAGVAVAAAGFTSRPASGILPEEAQPAVTATRPAPATPEETARTEPAVAQESVEPLVAAAPRIDTDLLFEAALAPAVASTEAAAPQAEAPAGALGRKTSPSISEMWRRVSAKASRAKTQSEEPLAPSLPALAAARDHDDAAADAYEAGASAPPESQPVARDHAPEPEFRSASPHRTALAEPAEYAEREPLPEAAASPPREPQLGDWFDRALAGLDEQAAPAVPAPEPLAQAQHDVPAEEAAHAERHAEEHVLLEQEPVEQHQPEEHVQHEDLQQEHAHGEPTAEHAAAMADEEPEVAPPDEAVPHEVHTAAAPTEMGRYQAEGTTYIMYSDGSIEAQSEQGVYRFGSMAELKAFFEEQAVVG